MCDERFLYNQNIKQEKDKQYKGCISSYQYNTVVRKNSTDINKNVDSLLEDIDDMLKELKG